MAGKIYVGIGGWTFEPWRGVFYPDDLTQKRELEYASRKLTSIEINGTYFSSFKPASWAKWRDETPDGFVFAVKASRFCTNRRVLADAGESVSRFFAKSLRADRLNFRVFLAIMPVPHFSRIRVVRAGRNSSTSATMPTSAARKIGAFGFLLMATMNGLPLRPARCWNEPLMPQAR